MAAKRAPIYRRAHAVVDTTGKPIAEVVAQVQAVELQVGDGTLAFTAEEVRDVIRRLLPD